MQCTVNHCSALDDTPPQSIGIKAWDEVAWYCLASLSAILLIIGQTLRQAGEAAPDVGVQVRLKIDSKHRLAHPGMKKRERQSRR